MKRSLLLLAGLIVILAGVGALENYTYNQTAASASSTSCAGRKQWIFPRCEALTHCRWDNTSKTCANRDGSPPPAGGSANSNAQCNGLLRWRAPKCSANTNCTWDSGVNRCVAKDRGIPAGDDVATYFDGRLYSPPTISSFCEGTVPKAMIRWQKHHPESVYTIDLNDDNNWTQRYWHKQINDGNVTDTRAPDQFTGVFGETRLLQLNPGARYYVRLYIDHRGQTQHSNVGTFKAATCSSVDNIDNPLGGNDAVTVDLKINFSDKKVVIYGFKTDPRNEDINYHYSWTSQNATSCTSNFNPSTAINASGKAWAASGTKNFTVTCTNGTSQASDSVKVVSLSANRPREPYWQGNTKLFMDGIFRGAIAKGWVVAPDFPAVSLKVAGSVTNTNPGGLRFEGETIYNNIAGLPSQDVNGNPANDVSEGKHRFEITIPSKFRDGIKRFLVVSFSETGTIINENRMVIIGGSSGARNLNSVNLEFTCQSDGSCTYKCVWPIAPLFYGSPRSGPMCQNLEW